MDFGWRYRDLDFELSEQFTSIVLGMDALYRSTPGTDGEASLEREGLVPINLTSVSSRVYSDWDAVVSDLTDIAATLYRLDDEVRRNYLYQQVGSVRALARWASGASVRFRDMVRHFMYINENPMSDRALTRLHAQLDVQLAACGLSGTLVEKVTAWETARVVPTHQLGSVLRDLLQQAKQRVVDHMFPEVADLEMEPVIVHNVPYSAYCDYVGRKMWINGDLSYTFEALKHLVAHEAFPGHATHMRIREQALHAGQAPADAGLVITNTASSPTFEGIGDNGMTFIDWVEGPDDRAYETYQLLKSICGSKAAHMIHEEGTSDQRVVEFLKIKAFADDVYAASRLRFFKHRLRAPFIYAYWRGYEAVFETFRRVPQGERQRFYDFLYRGMLSADTVRQFV
ncbi:hypothetical protein JI721_10535 [Alicyclobacillus cycloheptanicus]|uniref:DUF885 domain-containing protein n=1 Tax=Alicyclobacillus cycloheptanicus TaxID=1457 RepID=A0ABT9XFT3_9BACL|nr:hypothetical protein [Alicyclobacillus cycloheptanicus]MDQ0189047.1 hypothetical protein [Alicyclobacillus cycloheptanicus]WDM00184.1 hypothetical protein JI721_10535 [Alicyclobacillus cycloheptanicus]